VVVRALSIFLLRRDEVGGGVMFSSGTVWFLGCMLVVFSHGLDLGGPLRSV